MKIFKKLSLFALLFVLVVLPVFTQAETPGNMPKNTSPSTISLQNPFAHGNSFIDLLTAILEKIVMPIASVAVVVYIIYAGFTYITAQGNEKKITEAHQRLLWALVGAGILLGAFGISQVVQNTVHSLITP